jgi:potassium-transporting ATPase KdpC subunit
MLQNLLISLKLFLLLTVLTGIVYPLSMTGLAQAVFPSQANGSIMMVSGVPIGSSLIGQNFSQAEYFHGRPSAAGEKGYDGTSSGGSNFGPSNQKLLDAVSANLNQIRKENGLAQTAKIPSDLVLSSGSGLDPDISPSAAYLQVDRVARARNLSVEEIRQLVDINVKEPQLGLFGNSRVNVLELNLSLDRLKR